MKRKKYRFKVHLTIDELDSVPFVTGVLFAKIRLDDPSKLTEFTDRLEVRSHKVKWRKKLDFECKMSSSEETRMLDDCICRVSIRKELRGGRSFDKLGFVDINLAEYTTQTSASHPVSRKHILQPYNEKQRQDNSTLKFTIYLTMLSGDPVFKAPQMAPSIDNVTFSTKDGLTLELQENKSPPGPVNCSLLATPQRSFTENSSLVSMSTNCNTGSTSVPHSGHVRNASMGSGAIHLNTSTGSPSDALGPTSKTSKHIRAASMDTGLPTVGHHRNNSQGSGNAFFSLRGSRAERIGSTKSSKFESQNVVDEIFNKADIQTHDSTDEGPSESGELGLFILPDGTVTVVSRRLPTPPPSPPPPIRRIEDKNSNIPHNMENFNL